MISNPYYKPYWDSSNELEHYGVKGMKWGKSKKKSDFELRNTQFKDIKVGETVDWIKVNFEWDEKSRTLKAPAIEIRTKGQMQLAKSRLKQISKTPIKSIGTKIVEFGKKVISSILLNLKNQNRN